MFSKGTGIAVASACCSPLSPATVSFALALPQRPEPNHEVRRDPDPDCCCRACTGGCASFRNAAPGDPLEPINRGISFNSTFDHYLFADREGLRRRRAQSG